MASSAGRTAAVPEELRNQKLEEEVRVTALNPEIELLPGRAPSAVLPSLATVGIPYRTGLGQKVLGR